MPAEECRTPGEIQGQENDMRIPVRFLEIVALGSALTLAACGGADVSPLGSTATVPSAGGSVPGGGSVTGSGHGPGGPVDGTPGTGTCTHDCDGTGQGPGPGRGGCGDACTGPVGPDPADILTVLGVALQEEYKAEMLYRSVLEDFPGAAPFAVIVESETRHVEALQMLFTRREQAVPASTWTPGTFEPFESIRAACAGGVAAETEDAAFYAPYLERTDLPRDVRNVFTSLQAASLEHHLPAFALCQ
jgi:hypothetical protein